MSLFEEGETTLDGLLTLKQDVKAPPVERISAPHQIREIYEKFARDDDAGSYNRSIVQQLMDFNPPHDDAELENKGQSDRFNITTGEGPVMKNMAVGAYMDVYTTPKNLVVIPLKETVDPNMAETWSTIMAEEYSEMDRSDVSSLTRHLNLADKYVTHGVAIPYFDDKDDMRYSVAGLDHFKFSKKNGIVAGDTEIATATGFMTVTQLFSKIDGQEASSDGNGWNEDAVRNAIINAASHSPNKTWDNWEVVQQAIKSSDLFVTSICDPIEVVFAWIKEFSGKLSFYITTRTTGSAPNTKDEKFIFKGPSFFDSAEQAYQIFAFSIGNGCSLYTVRGMGYLIYQMCNAMDIIHCKLLDNARIGSSLVLQASSTEEMQDLQIIDAGSFVVIPPTAKVVERPIGQNLNNALMPALKETRDILNRATGGLASEIMTPGQGSGRETSAEVSSKLDFLNKLNSFAINLFYGPYDVITREKVYRAFNRPQRDKPTAARIKEMKERILARGVPEEVFAEVDWKRVKATRVIGTGSRSSRLMLMEQVGQRYSTWSATGQKNFDYDVLVELIGAEKAERYAGVPVNKSLTYDDSIAALENCILLEGHSIEPQDGQNHMVHLGHHVAELETGMQGIEEGQIDLATWVKEHLPLYQHSVSTMQITTVHPTLQAKYKQFRQQLQQIGEVVNNGLRMLEKLARQDDQNQHDAQQQAAQDAQQQAGPDGQPATGGPAQGQNPKLEEMKSKLDYQKQRMNLDLQNQIKTDVQKLESMKKTSEQSMAIASQKAMSDIVRLDAESQAKIQRAKQTLV